MATETQLDYYECIERVKRYIRNHLDEPINRDDLARLVGFSVPHVHHIFTAHPCCSAFLPIRVRENS